MEASSPRYLLYQALQCACSQDATLLKPAEQKLSEWEVEPGFYPALLNIFTDHSIDLHVRWMAAVYFKNGIDKYWRRNAPNEISSTEKAELRRALLNAVNEPVPQIAIQIAALIAKIARYDIPREWPDLVEVLVKVVNTNDQLIQHRALLVLQHVIKALASKRLIADKKIFEQLTGNIYSCVVSWWEGFTSMYMNSLTDGSSTEVSVMYIEKSILSLRIIRKLTIYGVTRPRNKPECMHFIKSMFECMKRSLEIRLQIKQQQSQNNLVDLTEKFILKQMKILREFLETHPFCFVEFITIGLEFSFNYVFDQGIDMIFENDKINFISFAIACIILMKGIVGTSAYSASAMLKPNKDVDAAAAYEYRNSFLTRERIGYICDKLISHYFLLTKDDLDMWDGDPEEFAVDECGDSWKYNLRQCTEQLYMSLFSACKEVLIPIVLKYVQQAQNNTLSENSTMNEIVAKDAIYNAAGLAAFHLFEEVEFDQWFNTQLLFELQQKGNNFRIIRRRIIWMVGQWTGVNFSTNNRPVLYRACLQLLGADEDMSVRLAASRTLMSTIDDFDFEADGFVEFLEPSFSLLFQLLKDAKECDTKMKVLYIMSSIVDKMGVKIHTQVDNLIRYLPMLWDESKEHSFLRCAIISTLFQIVKAFCDIPKNLTNFLYPVIEFSTNISNPSHIYLLEEGLELWIVVVENSKYLTPELLTLCENILPLIDNTSDSCRSALYLIQSYVLLNPTVFLEKFGKSIVKECNYLMSDMSPEGMLVVLKLFDTCLRANPEYSVEMMRPFFSDVFKKIYDNSEFPVVMGWLLSIMARVLLLNQSVFIQVLQEMNVTEPLHKLLDVWIWKMPLVTAPDKRKLMGLALGSLLVEPNEIIYDRFTGILQNICETLNDIMKDDTESGGMIDSLILSDESDIDADAFNKINTEEIDNKTYHYERFRLLCLKDPVYTVVLKEYIQCQITLLKNKIGMERYKSLMSTVDGAILRNLSEFVVLHI